MPSHKTSKEMEILIAKLNRSEIKWDDINKELEIMRKRPVRPDAKSDNSQIALGKAKRAEKV